MGENHTTPGMAREQGRHAALAGRPAFVNPHLGVDAEAWFEGYHAVPESERGSRPDLLPRARTVHVRARKTVTAPAMKARVHRAITNERMPKPWSEL